MKALSIVLSLMLVSVTAFADTGIVRKSSANSVALTIDKLEAIVTAKGFKVIARVDHAAAAANAGATLRPTQLLIFGNPAVGSKLMTSSQSVALDLPVKVLAFEDEDGQVWMSYNEPGWLLERHAITDRDAVAANMSKALTAFTDAAGTE